MGKKRRATPIWQFLPYLVSVNVSSQSVLSSKTNTTACAHYCYNHEIHELNGGCFAEANAGNNVMETGE